MPFLYLSKLLALSFTLVLVTSGRAQAESDVNWELCTKAYQAEIVIEKMRQKVEETYAEPIEDVHNKAVSRALLDYANGTRNATPYAARREALKKELAERIAKLKHERELLRYNFNECFR